MQAETRSQSEARRLDAQRSSASSRESPIIMSGPMVCAYIAGRKGETRRVVPFSVRSPYGGPGDVVRDGVGEVADA